MLANQNLPAGGNYKTVLLALALATFAGLNYYRLLNVFPDFEFLRFVEHPLLTHKYASFCQ